MSGGDRRESVPVPNPPVVVVVIVVPVAAADPRGGGPKTEVLLLNVG